MDFDFKNTAKRIIKTELSRRDIDYPELVNKLKAIGVDEERANLSNKINRGTFSFILVLQIFHVLGVKHLNFKEYDIEDKTAES